MNDILSLSIDGIIEEYKLLFVIDKEYQYIVYTDLDNNDINKQLYAIKTKTLNKKEKNYPISDEEWEMIESKYQELIKK